MTAEVNSERVIFLRTYTVECVNGVTGETKNLQVKAGSVEEATQKVCDLGYVAGAVTYDDSPTWSPVSPSSGRLIPVTLAALLLGALAIYIATTPRRPSRAEREVGIFPGYRFKDDNAVGASANALEVMVESNKQLGWVMVICAMAIVVSGIRRR